MINRIVLVGRLTADPEERHTNSGTVLSKFRIAVNRTRRGREGDPEADFFNVVCFGKTAEFAGRYMGRGDLVAIEGRCQIDRYTDRDGNPQTWVEVVADNVQKLIWDDSGGRGARGGREDRDEGDWDHVDDDLDADSEGEEPPADEAPQESRRGRRPARSRGRQRDGDSEGKRQAFPRDTDSEADSDDPFGGAFDDDDDPFADG